MAFLTSSQLFTYVMEDAPGDYKPEVIETDINVRLRDLEWSNENERDDAESKYMTGTWHGADESIVGKKMVTASYGLKVAPGEFTPATDPLAPVDAKHKLNYKDLFNNCGLKYLPIGVGATNDAEGMHVFYPSQSESQKTMSIARIVYDGASGKYQISKGAGAMSNFSITADGTAVPFRVAFDTSARSEGVEDKLGTDDVAELDEADIMRTVADSMRNTLVKITDLNTDVATELCITSMGLESGNRIEQIECQNTDSGLKHFYIAEINPTVEMDPLLQTLADFSWWEAVSTERFYSVDIQSEYVNIFIPRAQINENSVGDANGTMRNTITLRALINIDGVAPAWIPVADRPTKLTEIPYFVAIKESKKAY
jgi:hypothetical protein